MRSEERRKGNRVPHIPLCIISGVDPRRISSLLYERVDNAAAVTESAGSVVLRRQAAAIKRLEAC